MLTQYLTQTSRLLQNPAAPTSLYATADLTDYINTARNQLAGESFCVQYLTTVTTNPSTQSISFGSINLTTVSTSMASVLNVRQCWIDNGDGVGGSMIFPRPWAWFAMFSSLSNPASQPGRPTMFAQYSRGVGGSLLLDPTPDNYYTLKLDCVMLPVTLVSDSTPEAIPYPFTDCVAYLAAYYALLGAQSQARQADADRMFARYREFLARANNMCNPIILKPQYMSEQDMTLMNKLGLQARGQQ